MAKLIRDPQLDELVRELNIGDRPADSGTPSVLSEGHALETLLMEMAQRGASDLHIVAGSPHRVVAAPYHRLDAAIQAGATAV